MLMKTITLVLIFASLLKNIESKQEGETCNVARTSATGTCTQLAKCPTVLYEMKRFKRFPNICNVQNGIQVICCPNIPSEGSTNPTPTLTELSEYRISVRKCFEYKDAVFEQRVYESKFSATPVIKNESTCGVSSVPMIVGGDLAETREFPHMVNLGIKLGKDIIYICGGSLISNNFILTAAHCINPGEKYVALLGKDNSDENHNILIPVVETIKHPGFKQSRRYNDIALFRLKHSVQFNAYIRPACLSDVPKVSAEVVTATGWGTVGWSKSESKYLLKVGLNQFGTDECSKSFIGDHAVREGIREESQICAGSRTESKDACTGDSGGPLQIKHKRHFCMYSVVGVTSFGKGCGNIGVPGVYTRVYAYLQWIESIVWPGQ